MYPQVVIWLQPPGVALHAFVLKSKQTNLIKANKTENMKTKESSKHDAEALQFEYPGHLG